MSAGKQLTAIDLFSGVGGMSLGFKEAGFTVAGAYEIEERHVDTYRRNFLETPCHSVDLSRATGEQVRALSNLRRRRPDVVFGGPPCQGFSVGGVRDLSDQRNQMVFHFARLVRELRPRYFVMENVEGLLFPHARAVLKSLRLRLLRANYVLEEPFRVIDAADYGVPQRRRRVFLIGCQKGLRLPVYPDAKGIVDSNGNEYYPTVQDALLDLPDIEKYEKLFTTDGAPYRCRPTRHYAKIMRGVIDDRTNRSELSKQAGVDVTGCLRTRHSRKTQRRFLATAPGAVEPISRYYKLSLDGISPTIRAGTNVDHGKHTAPRPIHPVAPRCITTREAARLHSFPDWFVFHGTRWHAFRQIGNSVPPRLARAIAYSVRRAILPREVI